MSDWFSSLFNVTGGNSADPFGFSGMTGGNAANTVGVGQFGPVMPGNEPGLLSGWSRPNMGLLGAGTAMLDPSASLGQIAQAGAQGMQQDQQAEYQKLLKNPPRNPDGTIDTQEFLQKARALKVDTNTAWQQLLRTYKR